MQCPKCRGAMRTYTRAGIQIEQCDSCRGIFLDYGELEAIAQAETNYAAQHAPPAPPPAYGAGHAPAPAWGAQHGHHGHHGHYRRKSFMNQLFSS